jgi:hypothetical protein
MFAPQHIHVDVISDIDKAPDKHQVASLHALTPVKVSQAGALVAERGKEQAIIAHFKSETGWWNIAAISMAVLNFPDQRAGISLTVAGDFPGSEETVHAAKRIVFAGAFSGFQICK